MADPITVTYSTTVNLKPFSVPAFAVVDDDANARSINVTDLPPETVDALAQAWITALYTSVSRPMTMTLTPVVS